MNANRGQTVVHPASKQCVNGGRAWWHVLLAVLAALGCDQPATLTRYQVPAENVTPGQSTAPAVSSSNAPSAAAAIPQRMLATILLAGDKAWFFKAMGPTAEVDLLAETFREWQTSITLDETQSPRWTLPDGWTESPGNAFRFATLHAPNGQEVSVSSLSKRDSETDDYVLLNVNRWRGQLQLDSIDKSELDAAIERISIDDHAAFFVDLTGQAAAENPMGSVTTSDTVNARSDGASQQSAATREDTTSGSTTAAPANGASSTDSPPHLGASPSADDGGLTYSVPAGWTPGRRGSMRLAAFDVTDASGGAKAEVTLIALGAAAGKLLDNVNRWRGEIGMSNIDENGVDKLASPLSVSGQTGTLIRLFPAETSGDAVAQEATLVAMFPTGDRTLFVKMRGDAQLVQQQASVFEAFVKSFKFPK